MENELHHQSLNTAILDRPNSQRVLRLLREMQLSGADHGVNHLRPVQSFAMAGMAVVFVALIVAMSGEERGMEAQARSTLQSPAQPHYVKAEGG